MKNLSLNMSHIDGLGPPQIVGGPVDEYRVSGSDAVFPCQALAIPQHNITWSFMDASGSIAEIITTAASNTTNYLIIADENDARFGELTVRSVNYGSRGTYFCVAANEFGTHPAQANLTVQGKIQHYTFSSIEYLLTF